jgi:hypothetical protein
VAGPADIQARVLAIVGGTYPALSPYIPAGTFTGGDVFLPAGNPRFPKDFVANRHYDLLWGGLGYDADGGAENASDGPHILLHRATVRVQYVVKAAPALAPRDRELVLGGETAARLRAQQDARLLTWALNHAGAWTGVCPGLRSIAARVERLDTLRVGLLLDCVWFDEMALASAPATWSPA